MFSKNRCTKGIKFLTLRADSWVWNEDQLVVTRLFSLAYNHTDVVVDFCFLVYPRINLIQCIQIVAQT